MRKIFTAVRFCVKIRGKKQNAADRRFSLIRGAAKFLGGAQTCGNGTNSGCGDFCRDVSSDRHGKDREALGLSGLRAADARGGVRLLHAQPCGGVEHAGTAELCLGGPVVSGQRGRGDRLGHQLVHDPLHRGHDAHGGGHGARGLLPMALPAAGQAREV